MLEILVSDIICSKATMQSAHSTMEKHIKNLNTVI